MNIIYLFFFKIIILILVNNKKEYFQNENKTLVLFVFHIFNERVKSFIENCIFYDENIDFIIICNDRSIKFDCPDYVKKYYRDNI